MFINVQFQAGDTLVRGVISPATGVPFPTSGLLGGGPGVNPSRPTLMGGGTGINPSRF